MKTECNTDHNIQFGLSIGENRYAKAWRYGQWQWSDFVARCHNTRRTQETVAQYNRMSRDEQGKVKDVGGFVAAMLKGNKRGKNSVQLRTALTYDLDEIGVSADEISRMLDTGVACVIYSTHKHTTENPRLRIIIPLSEPVNVNMYEPAARMFAHKHGFLQYCDSTTFQPERLFYWPSTSRDGEFYFKEYVGATVDAANICLHEYTNWTDVTEWPGTDIDKQLLQSIADDPRRGGAARDPLTKDGLIGDYCRAYYPIGAAIAELLPDVYSGSGKRLTHIGGQTSKGVLVIDDRWVYSYHNSDPAQGRLCNIFDLVRIHRYGDLDEGKDVDTKEDKLPSMKRMLEDASQDKKVLAHRVSRCMEDLDVPENDETGQICTEKPDVSEMTDDWIHKLETDKKGNIEPTRDNIRIIMNNDPRLKNLGRLDQFSGLIKKPGEIFGFDGQWKEEDDNELKRYFEKVYKIDKEAKIMDEYKVYARKHSYHPVKDYLTALPPWDGVERVRSIFIDYLGAEDNELNRDIAGLMLTAAVVRIFQPGAKFDHCCVLGGPEGIGKSTVIAALGGKWFSDSIEKVKGKEFAEHLEGVWIVEFGELSALSYSSNESIKQQLSKRKDRLRKAYGRYVQELERECVFFGTTNDDQFLRGLNGNRRFLVVPVGVQPPKKDFTRIDEERDQIWAEVYESYKKMIMTNKKIMLCLSREMSQQAKARAEEYNVDESRMKSLAGELEEYLNKMLPIDWDDKTPDQRRQWLSYPDAINKGCWQRVQFSAAEFLYETRRMNSSSPGYVHAAREVFRVMRTIPGWEQGRAPRNFPGYGKQKCFIRTDGKAQKKPEFKYDNDEDM